MPFGFVVSEFPDVEAPVVKRWNNYNGYEIRIFTHGVGGPVTAVQIWKVQ